MRNRNLGMLILGVALLLICVHPAMAKSRGYLIVHVNPPETYIYADGEPVVESKGHYIILTPGEHQIEYPRRDAADSRNHFGAMGMHNA